MSLSEYLGTYLTSTTYYAGGLQRRDPGREILNFKIRVLVVEVDQLIRVMVEEACPTADLSRS
jgi:hypothetical protein